MDLYCLQNKPDTPKDRLDCSLQIEVLNND